MRISTLTLTSPLEGRVPKAFGIEGRGKGEGVGIYIKTRGMKRGADMKEYDVIVIGSGVGMNIVFNALSDGMKVALIDMGNVGGTCLNVGCVPSKMLVYPADRIVEIEEAKRLGLRTKIKEIDFSFIMGRMKVPIQQGRKFLKREIRSSKNLDFYNREAYFVDEYTSKDWERNHKGKKNFHCLRVPYYSPACQGNRKDRISYK